MRVVIVGAGGLGSYVGAVLARAGHEVTLVARGAHRIAIEERGLVVRSHAGDFTVHPRCVADARDVDGADLAFVATKSYALDDVAPQLCALAESGAAVVSLLNGVTAVDRLEGHGIDRSLLADGVAYMTSFRVEPGVVERKAAHQRIVIPGDDAAPGRTIREAFEGTLVAIEPVTDIRVALWEKLAVVSPLSVLCAIGERNMGSVRRHPYGADLQRQTIGEVLDVGRASGVPIPDDSLDVVDERLDRFPDDFFPSVIHDLNEGRRTEMDDLAGEVVRRGSRHGVSTPLHQAGSLIVASAEARAGR